MKNLLLMSTLIFSLSACFKSLNDPQTQDELVKPVDNQEYVKGDTIYFEGSYKMPVMEFNTGFLRVVKISTNDIIFNEEVGSNFQEKMVHDFDTATNLKVIFTVLKEDAKEESLIKEVTIKCL